MKQSQEKFLFLHQFVAMKLAQHFNVSPLQISIREPGDAHANTADLTYNGTLYNVKFSNPVVPAKNKPVVWDFDIRQNEWKEGRNMKTSRDFFDCDFYVFVGMLEDIPKKIFLVAASEVPSSHVRIAIEGKSKYQQYEI